MRETERVRQRLRDLEERKRSLQREKAELLSSVTELERFRGGDQVELNGLKLKVSQDESELMTLGMQLENTKHKLGAAEGSRIDATKENLQLRMCHQDWEEQCLELRRHTGSLSLKVTQLREAAVGKESEVRQLTLKLEAEMKLKCEAQSQLIECQRKLQLQASASEEQRCRIAALEAQVGVLTGSTLKSQSEKLWQTVEESQQQLRAMEHTKAALETRLHLQEAENASLSSQLLVINEDRSRLQHDLHTLISAFESSTSARGQLVAAPTEDSVLESGFHSVSGTSPGTKSQIAVRLFPDYAVGDETLIQASKPKILSPLSSVSPSKVRQIQETLVALRTTVKGKERDLVSIRAQSLEKDSKIWELEAAIGKVNARLDGLLAVARHFTSPGQSPVDKLSALERSLRTQNEGQLKADGKANALQAEVERLRLKMQSVETELESALAQTVQLRASRGHLQEERAANDRQARTYAQEREDEMEKVRRQLSATGRDLLESQQKEQRNAGELKHLNGQLKQLQVTVSRQKQEADDAASQIPVLAEHKRRLETELLTSKKAMARLEGELTVLKHQLLTRQEGEQKLRSYESSLQHKGSELESTVLMQKASMAEIEANLSATERELEASERKISRLDSELRNCAGERDILRKRVEILKGTQAESENQVSSLQLRVFDLQRVLNHTETTQIRTSRELKSSEEMRRQMRGELKSMKFELEKAKREYEQVQTGLSKSMSETARLRSEYEQERERYRKFLDESSGQSHLSHSLAQDLESDRESLRRKLMVREAESKELQAQVLGLHGAIRSQNDDHAQR